MSEDVYGRIGLLASRFRNAIDLALNESAEVGLCLRSFPKGCCGAASELLAQYLFENGIAATYVDAAHYYDNEETAQNHAWLEVCPRLVVDITRDQFRTDPDLSPWAFPVYVGDPDGFTRLFEPQWRSAPGYQQEGGWSEERLIAYEIICSFL